MRKLALAMLAAIGLAGCAVVPAEPPGVYAGVYVSPPSPPVIVVRPYYYDRYIYYGGHYRRHWRWRFPQFVDVSHGSACGPAGA